MYVCSTALSTQRICYFYCLSYNHTRSHIGTPTCRCISSSLIATAYFQCLCDWKLSFITRKLHALCIHNIICTIILLQGGCVGRFSQGTIVREREILSPLIVTYPRVLLNPLDDRIIAQTTCQGSDVVLNERGSGIFIGCGRSQLSGWRGWIYSRIGTYKIKKFLISKLNLDRINNAT